jgi:PHP family Zn ribbon phosphoesterase
MHECDRCEVQAKWKENEKRDFYVFRRGRLAFNKEGKRFITGCYYCGATLEPESADYESWMCPQCGHRTTAGDLIKLYNTIYHKEGE